MGWTLKQSSAVHIQALFSADVILLGSSSKLRHLVINLDLVSGGRLVISHPHKALNYSCKFQPKTIINYGN